MIRCADMRPVTAYSYFANMRDASLRMKPKHIVDKTSYK